MRTTGTFSEIYAAARSYAMDDLSDRPMSPVVRREGDIWMIESRLEPSDADFEVSLELFDDYFYQSYTDNHIPSDTAAEEFVAACTEY